ncbi:cytotoxic and regulatory T-cell molecule isoform X2 [Esox lucius]|nr:cytotoxic and regulatory T-cell molecule isoform X2 [Esox lucius]
MTLMEGKTLTMACHIRNAAKSHVEWKNPDGHVMFFNHQKALKDKRYKIINLSQSDFSISVSDVTFKDGGLYTCLHYSHKEPVIKKVEVTVLGKPKLEITEHNGKTAVKCSAMANSHPPKISWMLGSGVEIDAQHQPQYLKVKNTYSSMDTLLLRSHKRKVTIKCIVHHPALYNSSLMNFVKIGPNPTEESHFTTKASHWTSKQLQNKVLTTTVSHWPSPQASKATPTATVINWSSTRGSPASTPYSQLNTENLSSLSQTKNTPYNDTGSNSTNARDLSSVSQTTMNTPYNDTGSNSTNARDLSSVSQTTMNTPYNDTGSNSSNDTGTLLDETERQQGNNRSTQLFIFLVTCLILGLLIVVAFFGFKLRRAHILWKKENEDSDQSVESSKSKSSNEEKQSRGRRANGLFQIGFTKYVVEEPMATETKTPSLTKITEEAPVIQVVPQTNGATQSSQIKETEL